MNDNIRKAGYFFLAIFSVLVIYLGYLNAVVGPKLSTDPHNRRLAAAEEAVVRGAIYDRRGVVLAEDRMVDGVKRRVYPRGRETAHLLGFVSQRYGRTGLESVFDSYLLAMDDAGKIQALVDRVLGRQRYGYNVVLTIDSDLQRQAVNLLGNRRGAVVALDPRSGAVLAMVSAPAFDPASVDSVVRTESGVRNGKKVELPVTGYDILKTQTGAAPLLNRAARGIYPPGSTFKIITGAGALAANPQNLGRIYDCKGSIAVEGFELKDTGVHGRINFNGALAVSCNTAFAGLGLELGEEGLKRAAKSFGFNFIDYDRSGRYKDSYPVVGGEIPFYPGTLPLNKMSGPEVASAAIGQGRVLVSPLQMALVASAVANGGVVMKPAVLEKVVTRNGIVIKKMAPEILYNAVSPEVAGMLAAAMEEAVKRGTGSQASIAGVRVAGKTGSAQNPHGETHAWFIGFAPVENPRIAVAVLVENAGAGAGAAAPVARELIKDYLKGVKAK
ncbi:MAG: peptidoglycan D,D-transpeptidase FtsI family protein [Bacillota bacterium]